MLMSTLAANVMIHENGKLQVIDFGVAGVLQTNVDKRSTVIGTAHWMAPEMHKLAPPEGLNYGTEVSNHLTPLDNNLLAAPLTVRVRLMFGHMDARCTKSRLVGLRILKLSLDVCWE